MSPLSVYLEPLWTVTEDIFEHPYNRTECLAVDVLPCQCLFSF